MDGGRLNRLHRRHAVLNHVRELLGVVAMRIDTRIAAERHLRPAGEGLAEVIALQLADHHLLGDRLRQHAGLLALLQNEIVVIDFTDAHKRVSFERRTEPQSGGASTVVQNRTLGASTPMPVA